MEHCPIGQVFLFDMQDSVVPTTLTDVTSPLLFKDSITSGAHSTYIQILCLPNEYDIPSPTCQTLSPLLQLHGFTVNVPKPDEPGLETVGPPGIHSLTISSLLPL